MALILTIPKSSLNVTTLSLARLASGTSTTSSLTATCRGPFGKLRETDAQKLKTKMVKEARAEAAKKAKKLSKYTLNVSFFRIACLRLLFLVYPLSCDFL
jgi:hypothetical protein